MGTYRKRGRYYTSTGYSEEFDGYSEVSPEQPEYVAYQEEAADYQPEYAAYQEEAADYRTAVLISPSITRSSTRITAQSIRTPGRRRYMIITARSVTDIMIIVPSSLDSRAGMQIIPTGSELLPIRIQGMDGCRKRRKYRYRKKGIMSRQPGGQNLTTKSFKGAGRRADTEGSVRRSAADAESA